MHKKIDETNLSKPSLLLSNRNSVRQAGAQGAAAGEVRKYCARNTPPRQCCASVPPPSWSSTSPSRLSRTELVATGEEPCRSRAARSSCSFGWSSGSHQPPDFHTFSATVESASCLGCRGCCHGESISGGHQGSYVRPILSPMQLHLGVQFAYCIRVTVHCKIENHERLLLLYAFSKHWIEGVDSEIITNAEGWGLGGGWDLSPLPSLNATSIIIYAQSLLLLQIQSLNFEEVKFRT
jgi:hypothetical protein